MKRVTHIFIIILAISCSHIPSSIISPSSNATPDLPPSPTHTNLIPFIGPRGGVLNFPNMATIIIPNDAVTATTTFNLKLDSSQASTESLIVQTGISYKENNTFSFVAKIMTSEHIQKPIKIKFDNLPPQTSIYTQVISEDSENNEVYISYKRCQLDNNLFCTLDKTNFSNPESGDVHQSELLIIENEKP